MSIYDQDFNLIFAQLLPPDKRNEKMLAWGSAMMKPLQWLHDLIHEDYADGASALLYNSVSSYSKGDRIIFNGKVYDAKKTLTGVAPSGKTDDNWLLVLDDFRGARKRVQYNGQHLSLEYMLNEWFGTTFVQPDFNNQSNRSTFYIDTLITYNSSFIVFGDSSPTAKVTENNPVITTHWVNGTFVPTQFNFMVNYPLSMIPTKSSTKFLQMKALIERYKLYGTNAGFQGY